MNETMLSRIAENLYWMGRYVERAENTARLLGVNYIAMAEAPLVSGQVGLVFEQWAPLLNLTDDKEAFAEHHDDAGAAEVIEWFTTDRRNPGSIASSLALARENGRTLRGRISTEMWETLNRAWLDLGQGRIVSEDELARYCASTRDVCQLFDGMADASLVRGEGWWFLRSGSLLERLDNTLRILQLRQRHVGAPEALAAGMEAHRAIALLKSLSAYEAYRRLSPHQPNALGVAEFLLLSPDLPRSARFCADNLSDIGRRLARNNPTQGDRFAREARWLSARLGHMDDVTDLVDHGQEGLDDLLEDVAALSDVLTATYFKV